MAFLILNAGSSTLKFSVLDPQADQTWAHGSAESAPGSMRYVWQTGESEPVTDTVSGAEFAPAVTRLLEDTRALIRSRPEAGIDAVVHRVVHGGTRFTKPVRITPEVRRALADLTELAPLHNPPSLAVIEAASKAMPDLPHIAVFDTAFHATLAPEAYTYPLPLAVNERWGLRRYGFHGLSHAYCAGRAAEMLERASDGLRIVIAHLGNGASVTATRDGRSVDTSMGFTPLEGLMMGTRSGSVNPGLLLHLQIHGGLSPDAMQQMLYHDSGLLGISGTSSDMRAVLESAGSGDRRAGLAVNIFAHRARQAIGASAVTLGGVDALVFTGGIGEHSWEVRAAICEGLACLGLVVDDEANRSARPDTPISTASSPNRILVLAAREDLMMARDAAEYLQMTKQPGDR